MPRSILTHWIPVAGLSLLGVAASATATPKLLAYPADQRPDPFGGVVAADRLPAASGGLKQIDLQIARGSHASFHLAALPGNDGPYRLSIAPLRGGAPTPALQIKASREWFHFLPSSREYAPDALIPISLPYASRMPEQPNIAPKQAAQAFWVDIWAPPDATPGDSTTEATLTSGGSSDASVTINVRVIDARVPAGDAVALDHNSYGVSWIPDQYPDLVKRTTGPDFFRSDKFYELLHSYHRLFYEHRGVFHQLGYGHAGKVGPEFAPQLTGSGRNRRISSWEQYDRHYGPLLDGSAFVKTERGPRPIPFVYLPINPEWPASYALWGEPGYEKQFVTVTSAMEQHFRDRGWTSTRFELFFNHKKRYKGFPWDGDETKFAKDYPFFREYARLMGLAIPKDSPVKFVFRADVSWTMERQFRDLAGIINFWVCGGDMFRWYPESAREIKQRGDIVWIYGGAPSMSMPAAAIAIDVLRPWMLGVDGFVHWQVGSPGPDPWLKSDGGAEALVYPGDRFGVAGPIPSIRLKLQRNAAEDIALLQSLSGFKPLPELKNEVAHLFNGTTAVDWWTPRPKLADTDPEEWTNADIDEASPKDIRMSYATKPDAWRSVHAFVMELAGKAARK